ncbi:hypothetical protein RO3G_08403 [Rhizopus delemar RA 99-880]|uniref:Uncharacterized protein n=1 Tax=Rhizopus delemar (strain RA 99-880 / ATCC MYA-4621 / FGSC 9543 / NRRL 43880) TaxID=246409 RepID=I1C5G8_RHIO9|nr:hypothetical protein RO3G_08403 [Rhizopus delemar RA 99-880]|eukprot:EIE83698.1 hypothetical protein RO3G_08403 [Rhizopus delemar RA 99-880]
MGHYAVKPRPLLAKSVNLLKNTNLINFDTVNCPHPDCKKQFHTEQDLELIFKPEEIKEWWEAAYKITFMKNKYVEKVSVLFANLHGIQFILSGVMKIINEKEQLNKTLQVVKNNAWTRCPKSVIVVEAYEKIIFVSIIVMASQKKC